MRKWDWLQGLIHAICKKHKQRRLPYFFWMVQIICFLFLIPAIALQRYFYTVQMLLYKYFLQEWILQNGRRLPVLMFCLYLIYQEIVWVNLNDSLAKTCYQSRRPLSLHNYSYSSCLFILSCFENQGQVSGYYLLANLL